MAERSVRIPRWVYWVVLVAMVCTFLSQLGTGFDRPLTIAVGAGSAALALYSAVALFRRNRGDAA